ncbi:hypothetical protein [Mesorhizobium sp.]|uniref:hypothetical protein n=1 Tax=Mesorhizobium sp. TaxID=1871066 RepID=UPI000FE532C7|nr:hypothetical protein [Mesorhizobium sp.]RWO89567.1 MAG: competence protein ComEC [Mesorhizobium sp.]
MPYEIDFLPVGDSNGDAICIRYGSDATGYRIHVVDGGYTDTGDTVINHIEKYYGNPTFINHVVLSHADNDHVTGLIKVMEHFDVGELWMNRPWLYAAEIVQNFHGNYTAAGLEKAIRDAYPLLVEMESIALRKGTLIREAFAFTQIGEFTVLAPSRQRYLTLIPEFNRTPPSYAKPVKGILGQLFEAAKSLARFFETWGNEKLEENPPACTAANESSLVQLGNIDGRLLLLTADVGPIGLGEAADNAGFLALLRPPEVVQVPHHGSRRNVTPAVLNRWLGAPVPEGATRGAAFCSVGANKPEYPRKRVQNAFLRRGYGVVPTRDTWKSQNHLMPAKPGSVNVSPEPFVSDYEE